jgi:ketol-acid reductoisomerase
MIVDEGSLEGARKVIGELRDGTFAKRWSKVQEDDYAEMKELHQRFSANPLFDAERSIRELLKEDIVHQEGQHLEGSGAGK